MCLHITYDLCISLSLLWMSAPLTLCRLSERLEALEKRLESSKLQLVWSVPPIDIGIYLYCWQQYCIDINGAWLYYRISFVCSVLYWNDGSLHAMCMKTSHHYIQTEVRDIVQTVDPLYTCIQALACMYGPVVYINDGQHCNRIQLGQAIYTTVYVDQSHSGWNCLN